MVNFKNALVEGGNVWSIRLEKSTVETMISNCYLTSDSYAQTIKNNANRGEMCGR